MDTCQVNKTFLKNKLFKGVFPCDALPSVTNYKLPFGLIVNTDPASEPGEHWLAIFVNENNHAEIFDSFGKPPDNRYIIDFIENNFNSSCYNTVRVQHDSSAKCGQFAIGYLKSRLNGFSSEEFISIFNRDNLLENDKFIELFNQNCRAYKNGFSNAHCEH